MITNELFTFFEQLSQQNHKEWFTENKKQYEEYVKRPLLQIAAQIITEFSTVHQDFRQRPEDCLFRVNRDIRFSKNKSPYKTHASVYVAPGGKKSILPGFYLHLDIKDCFLACGSYQLEKDALFLVRQEIFYQAQEWNKIIQNPEFVQFWGTLRGDKNKRLPPEFSEYAEETPDIYYKSFYFEHFFTRSEATSPDFIPQIMHGFQLAVPLTQFLIRSLSELYEHGRTIQ
ncbi:MAG: DUF2461 domain-containing protein [Bacteroidia bacterium]|nr:DUF2461 domain-containing protein [Bacteroidia bacterium]